MKKVTEPTALMLEPLALDQMGMISELLTGYIQRVDFFLRRATAEAWADYTFRSGTIGALSIIVRNPGMSQNDIVKHTAHDKSAVNAIVNDLERNGWAERRPVPEDRRRHALYATAQGELALTGIVERVKEIESRMLSGLSSDEKKLAKSLLDRMHDSCLNAHNLETAQR